MKNIATDNKDGSYTYDGATYINTGSEYVQIEQKDSEVALYSTVVGENETPTLYAKSSTGYVAVTADETSEGLYTAVSGNDKYVTSTTALTKASETEGNVTFLTDLSTSLTGSTTKCLKLQSGTYNYDLNNNALDITSADGKNGIYGNSGVTATFSNGEITMNKGYGTSDAIVTANKGTITLDNMVITNTSTAANRAITVTAGSDYGSITIKNSKIVSESSNWANPTVYCATNSTVTIENSTIVGYITSVKGSITLLSGDFTEAQFKATDSRIKVFGGTFSIDPSSDTKTFTLGENCTVNQIDDSTWEVVQN
jgi:hypothetical protein